MILIGAYVVIKQSTTYFRCYYTQINLNNLENLKFFETSSIITKPLGELTSTAEEGFALDMKGMVYLFKQALLLKKKQQKKTKQGSTGKRGNNLARGPFALTFATSRNFSAQVGFFVTLGRSCKNITVIGATVMLQKPSFSASKERV